MNSTATRDAITRWSAYLSRYQKADGLISELDLTVYLLLLIVQDLFDEPGDIAELGVYHGGPFALLCAMLRPAERAHAIDLFDLYVGTTGPLSQFGNPPEVFLATVARISAGEPPFAMIRADTTVPELAAEVRARVGRRCRFFHVDGGHELANVRADLAIARDCVAEHPTPLIVVDDTFSPHDPAVTEGLVEFLRQSDEFVPFLITPAKTVLCRKAEAGRVAKFVGYILRDGLHRTGPKGDSDFRYFVGAPCLVLRPDAKPTLGKLDLGVLATLDKAEFNLAALARREPALPSRAPATPDR